MKFLVIADGKIPVMDSWHTQGKHKTYIMQIDDKYEKNIWKHFSCKHYWIKHQCDDCFLLIQCTSNPHQRNGKDASEWDIEEYKENDFLKDDGYKNKFKGKKVFEAYYAAKN